MTSNDCELHLVALDVTIQQRIRRLVWSAIRSQRLMIRSTAFITRAMRSSEVRELTKSASPSASPWPRLKAAHRRLWESLDSSLAMASNMSRCTFLYIFAIKFGLAMVRLLQETHFPASLHKRAPSVMRRDVASGDRVRLPHIFQSSVCGRYIPTSLSTLPIWRRPSILH